ncbi:cyclic pyranopterin phosphate synthase [Acinetobacter calcoaceticus]|uniref:GTP 3',8-cyclase n=1 Tax=Acinetobacter calcoaceticus TaxID=471 RepID=A0A4R1XSS6_ACICA|nr:cyclic pyranopterin phosphate synthase [Acinetobacter calcoaceticus]
MPTSNKTVMPFALNAMNPLGTTELIDQFGRTKHKLRISLTDRCNFRCSYCMPDHPTWLAKNQLLSFEALLSFCQCMVQLGIRHIRLTGGEPLLRPGVVDFVKQLSQLKSQGLQRISMTSNAYYLKAYATALQQSGLDDLNISLDSIDPATFLSMTQRSIQPILASIAAAQQTQIPIKLNCVLVAGQNDQQILELTQWAYAQNIPLRFIEYMPLDQPAHWTRNLVVSEDQVIQRLSPHFQIEKQPRQHDPATLYLLNQHYPLGLISTISKPFCQSCDRLRLTATGDLYSCLFAVTGTPLKHLLQHVPTMSAAQHTALIETILQAVWHKKAGYIAHQAAPIRKISMHAIGG